MKPVDQPTKRMPAFWRSPFTLTVTLFAIFILIVATSCGSYIFAPDESAADGTPAEDETITAAVDATVEVAVAATVGARENSAADSTSESTELTSDESSTLIDDSAEEVLDEQAQLMQWVVANTRHYIGDPNAPVVFIEFSDFQ